MNLFYFFLAAFPGVIIGVLACKSHKLHPGWLVVCYLLGIVFALLAGAGR